jgi:hypothetical protein
LEAFDRGGGMSRDTLCTTLKELYGIDPCSWDGYTLAEICQELTIDQLKKVGVYLGIV